MQLSVQISHLSINGNFINSTIPDFDPSSFKKSKLSIATNVLWILSLTIAMITASIGILVKQWFHELLSYKTHDPLERLKLRFFREAGIERWKVFAIASLLPLLLQFALLFFLIGIVLFFHQLDEIVAWFTTGTMILWLASLFFATFAPIFSSQCPYKTPSLKRAICRLRVRVISLPRALTYWLWSVTSSERFLNLQNRLDKLDNWFLVRCDNQMALEEESIRKDGGLNLPIISYTLELLQGEQLRDTIVECVHGISVHDMERTLKEIGKCDSSIHREIFPSAPHGPAGVVGSFALEVVKDDLLRSIYFGKEGNVSSFATLYFGLSHLHSEAYDPSTNLLISSHSLPAFVHLIEANPTSAAFSFLTMYSIQNSTLTNHPDTFGHLFLGPCDFEEHSSDVGNVTMFSLSLF